MRFSLAGGVFVAVFISLFVIFVGCVVYFLSCVFNRWFGNRKRPIITVSAHLIARRNKALLSESGAGPWTWYYLTFETDDGELYEFDVRKQQFQAATEGDQGKLTFQGSFFQGFEQVNKADEELYVTPR